MCSKLISKMCSILLDAYINIKNINLKMEYDEETKELQDQLLVIEEQLQKLKEKPKSMTEQQWIVHRQELIKTKNSISYKLKGA